MIYPVDIYGLSGRSKKELQALLSRSDLDLAWLDSMKEENQHYANQYFKELKYNNVLKHLIEKGNV